MSMLLRIAARAWAAHSPAVLESFSEKTALKTVQNSMDYLDAFWMCLVQTWQFFLSAIYLLPLLHIGRRSHNLALQIKPWVGLLGHKDAPMRLYVILFLKFMI